MAGAGVGKLPLAGEEPTKPQEAAQRAGNVRGVHEHAGQLTGGRAGGQTAAQPRPRASAIQRRMVRSVGTRAASRRWRPRRSPITAAGASPALNRPSASARSPGHA
jgi:hypothetical protein